jgi:predicted  nucleic acid-binding Zn-ribbon protein
MMPTMAETTSTAFAEKLRQAPLPVSSAVRYALQLADAFRQAHERNVIAGAVDPEKVAMSATGLAIEAGGTPVFVAPEVKAGKPADARSDVFVFGSIFYKMLTGRDPCASGAPVAAPLGTVYDEQGPVRADQIGGLDRLMEQCLATSPEVRLQRMQKVFLELKLLKVSSRRPEATLAMRREKTEMALRGEIGRVERSLGARVDACDRTLVEVQRTSVEVRDKLQVALEVQESLRAAMAAVDDSVAAVRDLTARLQTGMEENARTIGCVEEALSGQIGGIEEQLQAHAHSLEAMHTTMAQTDDLLERVVEAFDSLQAYVMDHSDDKTSAAGV